MTRLLVHVEVGNGDSSLESVGMATGDRILRVSPAGLLGLVGAMTFVANEPSVLNITAM